jgi:hypothetical protein
MTSVDGLRLFAPLMWENDGTANIPLKAGTANIPLEALQRGPGKRRHAPGGYSELARPAFLRPTSMLSLSLSLSLSAGPATPAQSDRPQPLVVAAATRRALVDRRHGREEGRAGGDTDRRPRSLTLTLPPAAGAEDGAAATVEDDELEEMQRSTQWEEGTRAAELGTATTEERKRRSPPSTLTVLSSGKRGGAWGPATEGADASDLGSLTEGGREEGACTAGRRRLHSRRQGRRGCARRAQWWRRWLRLSPTTIGKTTMYFLHLHRAQWMCCPCKIYHLQQWRQI